MARRERNEYTGEYTLELVYIAKEAIKVMNAKGIEVWIPKTALIEFVDNEDGTCTIEVDDGTATDKEIC